MKETHHQTRTPRDQLPFPVESELEATVAKDSAWRAGLEYGEPRRGHPEGTVAKHISEVLANIDRFYGNSSMRGQLRLIAILHDTFKYRVDPSRPKTGENHHGMRARRFAEQYVVDLAVLDVLELHDEAYNAWMKGYRSHKWNKAAQRARVLLDRLGANVKLYLAFFHCDNATGDKSQTPLDWFRDFVAGGMASGANGAGREEIHES